MGNATRHHARAALSVALSVVLALGGVPTAALAEAAEEVEVTVQDATAPHSVQTATIAEGTAGGCSWSIDADGRLDVWPTDGGSGTLDARTASTSWSSYNDRIKTVVVAAGTRATDLAGMFYGQQALVSADLSGLDTTGAVSANGMFQGCRSLESVTFGDGWNTSSVTDFGAMFDGCESLSLLDASGWSLASAQSAPYMFYNCGSLKSLSLSGEGGGSLRSAQSMFAGCSSLETLNLSAVKFGGDSASELYTTFQGCTSLASFTMGEALYQGKWGSLMNESRLPAPTAANGMWFSTADNAWMTNAQIAERGSKADTLLDHDPNPAPAKTDISSAQVSGADGWTYDGTTHGVAPVVTLGGKTLAVGTDYTLSGETTARDQGTYSVTVTGIGSYEGSVTCSYTVARKAVTVRADDKSKRQGEPDPQLTATVSGTLGSDTVSYTLSRDPGDGAGSYAITPSGQATQGNYSVTFQAGTLTVTAVTPAKTSIAGATVTVGGWTYDGTTHGVTPTVTLGGKTLAVGIDYTVSGATSATGAGEYELVVTGSGDYEGEVRVSYSVARKAATVRADDKSKRQGEPDPELTATVSGTLGSDEVAYTLSRTPGDEPGSYEITPFGDAVQDNYAVTFAKGTLIVAAADESDEIARLRGELEQAKAARDAAQRTYDAAADAAVAAEGAEVIAQRTAELQAEVTAADAELAAATFALDTAGQVFNSAQAAYNNAVTDKSNADAAVATAETKVTAAQAKVDAAAADVAKQAAIDAAQAELDAANAELTAATQRATKAQADLAAANAAKQAAQDKVDAQTEVVRQAAEAAANATSATVDELDGIEYTKGSLGLMQWLATQTDANGSNYDTSVAQGILTDGKYYVINNHGKRKDEDLNEEVQRYPSNTDVDPEYKKYVDEYLCYTDLGAEGDATSLENVRTAIQMMREANEIRAYHNSLFGLSPENPTVHVTNDLGQPLYDANNEAIIFHYLAPLNVSAYAMAASEVYANHAAVNFNHLADVSTATGIGDNLAATYRDPFTLWYHEEQNGFRSSFENFSPLLDENGKPYKAYTETVGHFGQFINESHVNQGFGVTQNDIYNGPTHNTYSHGFEDDNSFFHSASWTVDEFENLFNTYYGLVQAKTNGTTPKTAEQIALEAAQATLAQYQAELNDKTQAATTASTENDAAQSNKVTKQCAVNAAAANLQSVIAANPLSGIDATAAANELDAANTELNNAKAEAKTCADAVTAADQTLVTATAAKAAAQARVDAAVQACDAARTAADDYAAATKDTPSPEEAARLIAERDAAQRALAAAEAAYQAALGAYEGAVAANYDISYAEATVRGWTYDGEEHAPQATLTLGGRQLAEGTDYRVASGSGATNAGTHELVLEGTGACTGTLRVTYEVARAKVAAPAAASRTYDGSEQVGVPAGTGYTLSDTPRATDAGSYAATATPDANHCWEDGSTLPRAVTWAIARKRVTPAVSLSRTGYVYDGTAHTPSVTVRDGLAQLPASAYDVALPAASANAGPHTVRVTLKGNYEGSGEATFHVARATVAVPRATNRTYDGTVQVGVPTGTGYALSGTPRATNAGSYVATAAPDVNHCWGDGTVGARGVRWSIAPAAMSGVAIAPVADQAWTGGAVTPRPTVKRGATALREGSDYTLSYRNNVNPGTATVIVTGRGNYSGSRTATFRIVEPAAPAPAPGPTPHVSYRTHVQRVGWQGYVSDGDMSGTSGRSFRLEGINIHLSDLPCAGGIEYRTHVQRIGWQGWRRDGDMAGTEHKSYRLEAIEIRLYGELAERYDVYYRVHCQRFGWMGWARNGERSGSAGYSRRLEGIQIVLVRKGDPAPDTNLKGIRQNVWRAFAQRGKK